MSVLLKNGLVVTSTGSYMADVYVEGDTIKSIGTGLAVKADETVDATGKYILPGAIDPHTHIDMPFMGTTSSDDWKTGSIAAACGGTTSIIDFSLQNKGEMLRDAVDRQKGKADGKTVVDYSIHPGVTDARPEVIDEVKKAIHEYGTPSFKIFLFYDFRVDDYTMIRLLEETKKHGGLVQVHAESFDMIRRLNEQFAAAGEAGDPMRPRAGPRDPGGGRGGGPGGKGRGVHRQPDLHRAPVFQPGPLEDQAGPGPGRADPCGDLPAVPHADRGPLQRAELERRQVRHVAAASAPGELRRAVAGPAGRRRADRRHRPLPVQLQRAEGHGRQG